MPKKARVGRALKLLLAVGFSSIAWACRLWLAWASAPVARQKLPQSLYLERPSFILCKNSKASAGFNCDRKDWNSTTFGNATSSAIFLSKASRSSFWRMARSRSPALKTDGFGSVEAVISSYSCRLIGLANLFNLVTLNGTIKHCPPTRPNSTSSRHIQENQPTSLPGHPLWIACFRFGCESGWRTPSIPYSGSALRMLVRLCCHVTSTQM